MGERSTAAAPRRRLPAEEARARILAAAEQKLAEVGPEGLKLTELASELGISHPAILHHFGSRDELVRAVVTRAVSRFNERLAQALAKRSETPDALLEMIAEFCGTHGNARLIGWLVLSGRTPKSHVRTRARPLQRVIELAHAQRVQASGGKPVDYADTKFRSQLSAIALLGDAIFGDLIRSASGDAAGPETAREFRNRLAKLLRD
jgi:AcrR family transcriptional regulator